MESTEMKDQRGSPLAVGDDVIVLIGTKHARMQLGWVARDLGGDTIEVSYDYRAWYLSKDIEFKRQSVVRRAYDVVKVAPEKRP